MLRLIGVEIMRYLVTGGGTGGHIYPALAIASEIKNRYKDADILYVGTKKGLESELVPKEGFNFKTIRVKGMPRKLNLESIKAMKELLLGLMDANKIINDFKPDVVIGTGGYVCGPVVYVASKKKIPTLIHEQNAFPGITNRILSKYVDRVLVTFEESKKYFSHKEKLFVTGNPVRKEFLNIDKKACRRELGIFDDRLVVMVFGGSRGAEKLNQTMIDVLKHFAGRTDIHLIHITGEKHYEDVMRLCKKIGLKSDNVAIHPYVYEMPKFMGACDLVVCRAGAITLAEVTAMGLPAVLIPSPYVTNNHQEYNAKVLEKNGAAVVLLEKDLTASKMIELIHFFMKDRSKLADMRLKSKELAKTNATDLIYEELLKLMKE